MKTLRIGINGFGRIGRSLTRVIRKYPNIELVAINDLADVKNLAHLLKYDTVHGHFPDEVNEQGGKLVIDGREISVFSEKEPANIPWASVGVDLVIEATGRFKTTDLAIGHIKAGAKKVIISAPATDDTKTIVLGANDDELSSDDIIVSNASCTTNSVAPLLKIVDEVCGVDHAYITTVHSYTTDQQLQDGPHKDFRRGRAAAESIVPTSTGAAKAITRIFPELEGRIGGAGIRVPVPDGSLTDITITVKKNTTVEEINAAFKKASAEGPFKGYLGYTSDPIVSRDVIGSPYSVWFDEGLTSVLGNMVKVVGWYDNEMGYSHRLADLIMKMG
ncbi:type I glyceraldehyde-3-phosphate dehydrogenase [Owenweeksia hongkongensis]|uniref:type I glyceraldehyde-3-phosphate dehydrogenase n=1 Tax=Owenweeksia hongkongensis TaxID=253245 RepID=UPI003A8DB547